MELASVDLKSSLLSAGHQESYQQHQKLVRTYEEILESELKRANPILKGHTNAVKGIALTSDNSFLISCGKDNTLRIWSLIDRVQEQIFDIQVDQGTDISSMVLSPDNKFVILVISEKYLLIRTLDSISTTTRVEGKERVTIKSVAISNDSQLFCTADSEKTVTVYDLKGTVVKTHKIEDSILTFVLFANKVILIGGMSGKIRGWNTLTSAFEYTLEHTDYATAAVLYENNRYLAAGYSSGEVIVWNLLEKSKEFYIDTQYSGTPNGISYSSNSENKTIVFSNNKQEVIFVDLIRKNVKRAFVRHSSTISGVLQSMDGRLVITASYDKLIKIWQEGELRDHKASSKFGKDIKCSALDKNSDLIAIAYNDSSVKVINIAEDKEKFSLSWKGQSVSTAIWSHDKKQLITSNSTPEISVFSSESKSLEFVIPCDSTMNCLFLSPDSKILYGCSEKGKIISWNYQERTINHEFESEGSSSPCVLAFSPDWTKMYSGDGSIINIWDLASKTIETKLEDNNTSVKCLVPLSNGKTLISGGDGGQVNFWNLEENQIDVSIDEESAWARAMDLFNKEKFLVIVHDNPQVTVVNVEEKKIEYEFQVSQQYSCKVLNDKTLIMGDMNTIRFYNLTEQKEEAVIKAHTRSICTLLIDNDSLISCSADRSIKSWKLSDKSNNGNYQAFCNKISTICLSKDYLGVATEEGIVMIYPTNSKRQIKSLQVHSSNINSLEVYGSNFATGSDDKKVGIFDVNNYKVHYIEGHSSSVRCVKFSSDGKMFFSASDDALIKAWNVQKKTLEFILKGHQTWIYSLCVFPSGNFIASSSGDGKVKVWDLELRKEDFSFENHSKTVNALCISDDEEILFSGSNGSSIAALTLSGKRLICSMTGHSSFINSLALYKNVLFSTSKEEIKNWLYKEKKEILSFGWDTTGYATCLVLSPDEKYLAATFDDKTVRIYDFKQGKFLQTFQPFSSSIPMLSFTKDSKSLLLSIRDSDKMIWDIEENQGHILPGTKSYSSYFKFSPDFSLLATFSNDFKAIVWNWTEKKILHSLEGHGNSSQAMIFSHDNKFLFVGTEGGAVFKWNLETLEKNNFKEHRNGVIRLAFSESRNLLISAEKDRKIIFYDLEKNEIIKAEVKNFDEIKTMTITKDEKFLIVAGSNPVIIVWDLDSKTESFRMQGHSYFTHDIAVSSDSNNLYSCSGDKLIQRWSLHEKRQLGNLRFISGNIYSIVITKDGSRAYTGSDKSTINVFDLASKKEVACLCSDSQTVCSLALSEDETLLVSGSSDTTVRVLETSTFAEVARFKGVQRNWVNSVAITRNKKHVISISNDQTIVFWNLENKEKEFTLEGHKNKINSLRLTFDEKFLISASDDETIKLWDILDKSEVYSFSGHTKSVKCLEVFRDNKGFISAGEDNLIKAWSIQEKREDYSLNGHNGGVSSIKLTSDNLRLISGSVDSKIIIWDLEKRMVEHCLTGFTTGILAVNITEQGDLMLTSEKDNMLKLWKMSESKSGIDQVMTSKPFVTVHTPDERFELTYLYGSLREVAKKNSTSNKLEMGNEDLYDPYYQNLMKYYNLLDSIQGGQYETILDTSSDAVFSKFLYTIFHILANFGNTNIISSLFSPDMQLKKDYFGKSPLYYAIIQQHQECVEKLLAILIIISESKDFSRIFKSLSAISNDLPLIIRNSSKNLHVLLQKCFIQSVPTFVKISENLPIFRLSTNILPNAQHFIKSDTTGVEIIPVIMKYTPFTIPFTMGSEECIDFLESIIECSNSKIYNTHLIQFVLQIQWDQLIGWVFIYTLLLWSNLILLVLLFTEQNKIFESWSLPVFLLVNLMLIIWESIQMLIGGLKNYFKDPWNFIDFLRFWLSMGWVVMNILQLTDGVEYRILAWAVALFNFTRGLTGFRLFDGTRYYVRLILRALVDMGYFFIILGYSTITFGVMFQVSRHGEAFEFKTLWMDSYSLNFGNFEAQDNYNFSFETVAYMLATVVNVILMLNLLIAILGDSFESFQSDKVFVDYMKKHRLS